MTAIWAIIHSSVRGYRTFRGRPKSSWESVLGEKLMPESVPQNANVINDEEYDFDSYESNFAIIGEFHKIHEKEIAIQKKKIYTHITKQKYFKNKEPILLTWEEMKQIRLLHSEDPNKWSLDRLSESFPASRETITKILRSKWLPKSVEAIRNHDVQVLNNWKLLKVEKLAVNSKLHKHLMKFRNRNIKIMDQEVMEKMITVNSVYSNRISNMFSNIIQGYINSNSFHKKSNEVEKMYNQSIGKKHKQFPLGILDDKIILSGKHSQETTYDMFLKKYVENIDMDIITPVDQVIVNENKQQNSEAYKSQSLVLESKSIMGNFKQLGATKEKTHEVLFAENIKQEPFCTIISIMSNGNSMETGVITRQKKVSTTPDDYLEFIKIPHKSYKPKAVYRIQDRYYDNDGEFLYRVPGILS
ncbi:uncharacterized protein [Venturia canescens]|uniref:uncharacterized protein n=1 Tax=Venturia canescens TaxID=32260 RepID=UPI001C9C7258|nr:uncharacterized protein LOC122418871 [Venturia canescens]